MTDWQNRIIETAEMAVSELKANPKNWRKHPTAQQNALAGVLDEVGWVTQVVWNRQTGHLVDGHLRVKLAAKRKEKTVPVNVVDLSPEEEAMAEADRQMHQGLMQSIETENAAIREMIDTLAATAGEVVDIDDLLNEIDPDLAEPRPIWIVARAGQGDRDALDRAAALLEAEGVRVERSYGDQ